MTSKSVHVVMFAAAVGVALSACQRADEAQAVSNGQPTQMASGPAQIQVGPTRDLSLPDASAIFAAQDAADKASAVAVQQAAAPQPEPAKSEESKGVEATPAPDRLSVAPENSKVN